MMNYKVIGLLLASEVLRTVCVLRQQNMELKDDGQLTELSRLTSLSSDVTEHLSEPRRRRSTTQRRRGRLRLVHIITKELNCTELNLL